MARKGRIIAALIGLLVVIFILSPRNSRSHSRNMRPGRFEDGRNELHRIIKEPPGVWDPVEDKFRDQPKADIKRTDRVSRQGNDLPDQQKPLDKGNRESTRELEEKAKGRLIVEKEPKQPGTGERVVKEETDVNQYNATAGYISFNDHVFDI